MIYHWGAAVSANKHVFAEKPVAVDAPGVRAVLAACEDARQRNLSIVSGLCYRYDPPKRALMARIHDGGVGQILSLHTTFNTGGLWMHERQHGWSDMEWQMRNWLYFTWLSGDHIVEQHVHSLDKMAWVMGDTYPIKCLGLGGRQVRTEPEYGMIYDHHAVVYEYASGVKCFSYCRQQDGTQKDVNDYVYGTNGMASLMEARITGKQAWKLPRNRAGDMYQNEHDELFASIRAGKPINNGDYMCQSTLMAIMGRMATYTGQTITWDMLLDATGEISGLLELRDNAAKKGSGRCIPIHPDLAAALAAWRRVAPPADYVITSERGGRMTPLSIVVWFNRAFKNIGLKGCSSHSGRRTFVTRAARVVHKAGGCLRDVQLLAGHRSIQTTQRYIDGDSDAQRKLVAMI